MDALISTTRLPALPAGAVVPAIVAERGEQASWRYLEFFAVSIRNPNTRAAYGRAASAFFGWCERLGLMLPGIQPVHVAAWIEELEREGRSAPTVKQHLAAVRMLFDWLVVGQVVAHNPAAAVRGPKHSMGTGKTHMPSRDEAKALIAAIDMSSLIGLRDRALIGMMLFTFVRIGAITGMRVGDYYPVGKRWWVRLHEQGGKEHTMPAHHTLQEWLDAYLEAAGIGEDKKGILFRTAEKRSGRLTEKPLAQADAYRMVQQRRTWQRGSVAIRGGRGGSRLTWKMAGCSNMRKRWRRIRRREQRSFMIGGVRRFHSMRWSAVAFKAALLPHFATP